MNWGHHAKRVLSAVSGISRMEPPTIADINAAARLNGFTVSPVGAGHFRITRLSDNLSTVTTDATAALTWMKEHAQ